MTNDSGSKRSIPFIADIKREVNELPPEVLYNGAWQADEDPMDAFKSIKAVRLG